ncbi:MAG: NAD(P)-binding domain-containing protein [Propionicimonas sp.]
MNPSEAVDVVVIGAGQAGLSAGHHLRRRGFRPVDAKSHRQARSFVVLDANHNPGGAWQHRWRSLLMATVNGIYDLPGMHQPPVDPSAPSAEALPPYFAAFEASNDLQVRRPVTVTAVRRANDDPNGRLMVESSAGTWAARWVINATGTWTKPYLPEYPGADGFRGRQLHVRDYVSASEFAGQRVVIVGAGVSAVQLLNEISKVASTYWVTRREPVWEEGEFDEGRRIAAIQRVVERARQGLGPVSIVSITGMYWTPWAIEARDRGVLVRHPMFTAIEPDGVRTPDGELVQADAILWATGFHPAIDHLAPLGLKTPQGGIRIEHGRALDESRLFLIGYGPSQSTVGANRAGWEAVRAIMAEFGPVSRGEAAQ